MSPSDRQTLVRKLGYLEKNLAMLTEYQSLTLDQLESSPEKRFAAERLLQTAIESCVDCARILVLLENWRPLRDERDAFLLLVDKRVIDDDLAQRMMRAKGFRNILVHEYINIDPILFMKFLEKDLGDLQVFASAIANFLRINF